MTNPYFFGWLSSDTGLLWKWIRWSTPAFRAFSRAAFTTSPSISYPWISVSMSSTMRLFASSITSYQCFFGIRCSHCSARNSRFIPGAMFAAIMAASMGNVPDPQKGSTRMRSFFQGVSMMSALASVSEIGAFAVSRRYPLLWRETPVVSMPTVTSSFMIVTRRGNSGPVSGNSIRRYFRRIRSTIAFFMMD